MTTTKITIAILLQIASLNANANSEIAVASEDQRAACYANTIRIVAEQIVVSNFGNWVNKSQSVYAAAVNSIVSNTLSEYEIARSQISPSIVQVQYSNYSDLKQFVTSKNSPLRKQITQSIPGKSWFYRELVNADSAQLQNYFYNSECEGVFY